MYELSRNRYKELKHFCLQYNDMKEEIEKLRAKAYDDAPDPTGETAAKISDIEKAMKLIETTAFNVGNFPGEKILKIVTEDLCVGHVCSDKVSAEHFIRKFYWMLSKTKGV